MLSQCPSDGKLMLFTYFFININFLPMKLGFLLVTALISFFSGLRFFTEKSNEISAQSVELVNQKKMRTALSCSPDWSTYQLTQAEIEQMVPLPGTGSYTWDIHSRDDSAQFYFNQGIKLYYGFHIIESLPSFKKAQLFDSTNAMLYWGEALAYGPNINDAEYSERAEPLFAIRRAEKLSTNCTPKEKVLIQAMLAHYSGDSAKQREELNIAYAEEMEKAYTRFPNDGEIGALYADAIMNTHPWDTWDHHGKPKLWTPELIDVLEGVLKNYPDHPGANHYYIHTMEAGPFAIKANNSAEKLGRLAPGLSHLVHMPSHIYIRTGQYAKGIAVNEEAVKVYEKYLSLYPEVVNNAFIYDYHNRHMQAACSINSDNYAKAIADALECQNAIDTTQLLLEAPFGNYLQYIYMTPQLTMIAFEKWKDILEIPDIDSTQHFGSLIQTFAKGLAYTNTGRVPEAKNSLKKLDYFLGIPDISTLMYPFNAPVTPGRVARHILQGAIYEKENNMQAAIESYKKGVATEDSLVYQEPRDWLVPARHFLGKALLKEKHFAEAANVFKKDLTYQPENYTSATGLKKALQHKK